MDTVVGNGYKKSKTDARVGNVQGSQKLKVDIGARSGLQGSAKDINTIVSFEQYRKVEKQTTEKENTNRKDLSFQKRQIFLMADNSSYQAGKTQEEEQQAYYQEHKAVADRILACDRHDHLQILGLEEPITEEEVYEAFESLSCLLSPECNIAGQQYEGAQEAHNCKYYMQVFEELLTYYRDIGLWEAAKQLGVDMSEYWGNNDSPPVFAEDLHIKNVPAAGNDDLDPSQHHDDKQESGSRATKLQDSVYQIIESTVGRILQCNPEDHRSILEASRNSGQSELDFSYLRQATIIKVAMEQYRNDDGFLKKLKQAYESKYSLNILGVMF